MKWWIPWLLCLLVALPGWAQDPDDAVSATEGPVQVVPGKVKLGVEPFADGLVRDGAWSSVRVILANGKAATEARLSMQSRTMDASTVQRFERTVELPRGARKDVDLAYQPGLGGATRTVTVGVGRDAVPVEFPIQLLGEGDVGIAVIGLDTLGVNAIPDAWGGPVPGRRVREPASNPRSVRVGLVPHAAMPESSTGWDAVDWVVWPAADPSRASAAQLQALSAWVADGGHLLVTVTDTWQAVKGSPLDPLLPVELTGVGDSEELGGLTRALGGTSRDVERAPVGLATVRDDVPGRRSLTLSEIPHDGGTTPVWVAGNHGLGTVHVLLADPALAPLTRDLSREGLWRRLLWLPPPGAPEPWLWVPLAVDWNAAWSAWQWSKGAHGWYFRDYSAYGPAYVRLMADLDLAAPSASDFWVEGSSHYVLDSATTGDDPAFRWESRVREYLSEIPGVAPLPLSWLILFSGLYLLVIGPVDYIVLRLLKKQPWTWITFPVTIVVFSAAALIGTSMVKGNQAVLTRLEVVDVLPGTDPQGGVGWWRGDTYLGVWATRKTDLVVTSGFDDAVVRPLQEPGTMYEPVIRTTAGSGELAWRAETWTLAYVRSSWTEPRTGRVWVEGTEDRWAIHNDLGVDLDDASLVARGEMLSLGAIPDGGHATVARLVTDPEVDQHTLAQGLGQRRAPPGGSVPLRTLEQVVIERGTTPAAPTDVLSPDWATYTVLEHPETGRGHLDLYGQVALIGTTDEPIEPIELSGLRPVTRAVTVFRAPLMAAPTPEESTP